MKIGIFGGTFDPMTQAHLAIVCEASKKLDTVFIVPTTCDYYKQDRKLFSFDERVQIIRKMISGCEGDIKIDTVEKDKDSKWRTVDTVEYFKKKYPNDELFLIIGKDSYEYFTTWYRFDDILNVAELMVVERSKTNGYKDGIEKPQNFERIPYTSLTIGSELANCSATKVREKLVEELLDLYLSDTGWYSNEN